ncbi:ribonuclease-domain-containing protein [Aaosphaeria arxii CBS 175.79]|uniref:ribonuclease T1 n=1 Tax=Aaosphaeria arxii CBS 175.79 TaxID=1450172 RepID=A0A6A5XEA1_9PLEO|nr:ribonuclease-domain-containing protein [Aaosphaeria arxii CBS 175.79]KAF2011201.1 ribonuclease-domain-containing protein [Aaosphaeria arxii CBS 175.79]
MQFLPALLLALTPLSLALPTTSPIENTLEARQCATTCGSVCYSSSTLSAARSAAANYVKNGGHAGSSTYPHVYNNYEDFNFAIAGPYYEFPILSSGKTYTGGSPGPDRVVINKNGARAGEITHTGASGNNFVGCSGTS